MEVLPPILKDGSRDQGHGNPRVHYSARSLGHLEELNEGKITEQRREIHVRTKQLFKALIMMMSLSLDMLN